MRILRLTIGLVLLLGWTAPDATAQSDTEVRGAILQRTNLGDRITVTLGDGAHLSGRLVSAKDALIVQTRSDQRTIPFSDVRQVTRRTNGILLGAIIGTAGGLALGLPVRAILNAESMDGDQALLVFTVTGAAIGVGLDALMAGERTVYSRPHSPRSTFAIAPAKGGISARLSMNW